MIYLDNSASTYIKPKEVLKAVNDSLLYYSANPGRSGHQASIKTAIEIENVREILAKHFNATSSQEIVFTQNCTEALNTLILGLAKPGNHIICTENEHNSVLRPLEFLKKNNVIEYSIAYQSNKKGIEVNDIEKYIKSNTKIIICNHISNVNGDTANIKEIGEFCKKNNLIFIVDCAQSCGHKHIDIQKNNINFLTFAGHKGFYAPQSIGGIVMNSIIKPSPLKFGGTGTNSLELVQPDNYPDKLESGTLSTPLILGLGAGVEFVEKHFESIKNKIDDLTTYLLFELNKIENIEIYTHPENSNGVIAFNIKNINSNEIANLLNEKYNICVRGGYHCAPIKHKALNTISQGAIRVSLSFFNNFSDIERLLYAIKHLSKLYK